MSRTWEEMGTRLSSGDLGFLLALLLCASLPFLVTSYMPVEDGPAHLANAAILGRANQLPFSEYFDVAAGNGTNVLAHFVLAALLTILPAAVADKVMAIALLAAIPLAVRWTARAIDPAAGWLAILVVPASAGFLLYMGLYNFLLGALLSILALGFWLRRRGRFGPASGIGFVIAVFLVYASHPLPFLALLLGLAAGCLDEGLTRRNTEGWMRALRPLLLPIGAAVVVPAMLLLGFGAEQATEAGYTRGFLTRGLTFPLDLGLALGWSEAPFVLLHTLAIAVLCVVGFRASAPRPVHGFLVAALLVAVIYFVGPDAVGEGYIILPRTAFYLLIFLILWLARRRVPPRAVAMAGMAVGITVIGLTLVRIPSHVAVDRDVREFLSDASMIERGSTVVTLWGVESGRGLSGGGRRIDPLVERTSALVATRSVIDLGFYPGYLGTFRVRFRPDAGIASLREVPFSREGLLIGERVMDLSGYRVRHGRAIDYVRIWRGDDAPPGTWELPAAARLADQLETAYDRVYTSDGGRLALYRAKRAAVDSPR